MLFDDIFLIIWIWFLHRGAYDDSAKESDGDFFEKYTWGFLKEFQRQKKKKYESL